MKNSIKAELRKLISVRSTYFIALLAIVLVGFFTYMMFASSQMSDAVINSAGETQAVSSSLPASYTQMSIASSVSLVGLLAAVVGILLMAHEYRYRTIDYSVVLARRKVDILAAKAIVISIYAIIMTALAIGVTLLSAHLAIKFNTIELDPQAFTSIWSINGNYWPGLIAQSVFYVWGMAIFGFLIVSVLRNLVAAMAFIFIFPSLEYIVRAISDTAANWMPFISLEAALNNNPQVGDVVTSTQFGTGYSAGAAMLIFVGYQVVVGAIAVVLFFKRDASDS